MTSSTDLEFYLRVAIDINKKVGGSQAQSNIRERFVVIRDEVTKSLSYVRMKLQEKRNLDPLLATQLKQKLSGVFDQLERMREAVSYENGASIAVQQLKYQLVDRLTSQAKELQAAITEGYSKKKEETITQIKSQLLDTKSNRVKQQNNIYSNKGPNEYQQSVMKRWNQTDKQIDAGIDQLVDDTKRWKEAVLKTGILIDQTDNKIQSLTKDVDKINQDLFNSNKKLKEVVQKLRKPHKFCIDIVLVLILIGLIVAIVKLSKK